VSLRIFESANSTTFLKANQKIPLKTGNDPFFVSINVDNVEPKQRDKRLKRSFCTDTLKLPGDIVPWSRNVPRPFISIEEWDYLDTMLQHDFETSGYEGGASEEEGDKDTGFSRVPPMALVRCSRGGKTRALSELAKKMTKLANNVFVIFVAFNEWSPVTNHTG
jgi:hypothetical protein